MTMTARLLAPKLPPTTGASDALELATTRPLPVQAPTTNQTAPSKRQRLLDTRQREILDKWIEDNVHYPYIEPGERHALALRSGLSEGQIIDYLTNYRKRKHEHRLLGPEQIGTVPQQRTPEPCGSGKYTGSDLHDTYGSHGGCGSVPVVRNGHANNGPRSPAVFESTLTYPADLLGKRPGIRRFSTPIARLTEMGQPHSESLHGLTCYLCHRQFAQKSTLRRHLDSIHGTGKVFWVCQPVLKINQRGLWEFSCPVCDHDIESCPHANKNWRKCWRRSQQNRTFARSDRMLSHLRTFHELSRSPISSMENFEIDKQYPQDESSKIIRPLSAEIFNVRDMVQIGWDCNSCKCLEDEWQCALDNLVSRDRLPKALPEVERCQRELVSLLQYGMLHHFFEKCSPCFSSSTRGQPCLCGCHHEDRPNTEALQADHTSSGGETDHSPSASIQVTEPIELMDPSSPLQQDSEFREFVAAAMRGQIGEPPSSPEMNSLDPDSLVRQTFFDWDERTSLHQMYDAATILTHLQVDNVPRDRGHPDPPAKSSDLTAIDKDRDGNVSAAADTSHVGLRTAGLATFSPNEPISPITPGGDSPIQLQTLPSISQSLSPLDVPVYKCTHIGCSSIFGTQYLLNAHMSYNCKSRPHFCPIQSCPRARGGRGFRRKNEVLRHGLVHASPGYICPFCPSNELQHRYPRAHNLQRHLRIHHRDIAQEDPDLWEILRLNLRAEEVASKSRLDDYNAAASSR